MSKLKSEGYKWLPIKEAWESLPELDSKEINEMFRGYSGIWCRYMWTVTSLSQMFKDVVVFSHATLSCVASAKNFLQTHFELHSALPFHYLPCTDMDENMVVMGGDEGLAEALREVDREYRPKLIAIVDSCSPFMIHDDVQRVIDELQDEVRAKMVFIPSPGFLGVECGKALEAIGPLIVSTLMDPPEKKVPDAVNVLGFFYDTLFTEAEGRKHGGSIEGYRHLIEGIGLKLHRINAGTYDYFRTAPEAAVNTIHTENWGYPMAREMEERFGVPWLKRQLPMGISGIRGWVMDLAKFMNKEEEAEKFLRAEEEKIMPLFEEAKKAAEGKVLLVECSRNSQSKYGEMMIYGRLGEELGMKPYIYSVHPVEFKSQRDALLSAEVEGLSHYPILIGPYPYQQPVSVEDVIEDLGVAPDQCIYIYDDVFPYAKSGSYDPSNAPRYTVSVQMKRVKGASFLGVGYSGTAATYQGIIEAVKAAKRGGKYPTFYGRMWSKTPFEFQFSKK